LSRVAEPGEMREPLRRALAYPYPTPERSFLQLGERTLELPASGVDLANRQPLLAYGANAAPAALTRKLATDPNTPLPLIRAELDDFDVVYSAHVSPYGSVPATLRPSLGTTARVFVAFPTENQRRLLSATEPNYGRQRLEGISCRSEIGARLEALEAFVSRHGSLLLEGSEVALSAVPARNRRLPAMTQPQVLEQVRSLLFPERSLEQLIADPAWSQTAAKRLRAKRASRP
jgi:hypothetical protein